MKYLAIYLRLDFCNGFNIFYIWQIKLKDLTSSVYTCKLKTQRLILSSKTALEVHRVAIGAVVLIISSGKSEAKQSTRYVLARFFNVR